MWCFGPEAIVGVVDSIRRQYRWSRLILAPKNDDPFWRPRKFPRTLIVGDSMGEYNGCLGFPSVEPGVTAEEHFDQVRRLARSRKVSAGRSTQRMATKPDVQSSPLSFPCGGSRIEEAEVRAFLRQISSKGPVLFVLDDAETHSEEGEKTGLPVEPPRPNWREVYTLTLRDDTPLRGPLPIPFWVPVTIVNAQP
jgi:hypothetical protein